MSTDQTNSHRLGYRAAGTAAAVAALTLLGGCISSTTYGTGESPGLAVFREIGGGVFGGILGKSEKDPIGYQQRAPIVAPPETSLPVPAQAVAAANPDWPDDPDRNKRAELSDEVTPGYYKRLGPLARLTQNRGGPRCSPEDKDCDGEISAMEANDFHAGRRKVAAAIADAESVHLDERRYLTDPPDEFRAPAETAPTEFEDIKRERKGLLGALLFGRR